MRKAVSFLLLSVLVFTLSGCVVRSVCPWLADDTRVTDVSLAGSWRDSENTATFTLDTTNNVYEILFVDKEGKKDFFAGSLHRLDGTLLLMVGPGQVEMEGMCVFTLLPAYLLFKVEAAENSLKLYAMDLDTFPARLKKRRVKCVDGCNKEDGYVLLSQTAHLTAFVKSQLKDKSFFGETPMYDFTGSAGAPRPTNAVPAAAKQR